MQNEQESQGVQKPEFSEADFGVLESKVKSLEEQLQQEKNKYLYLYSDFENYKKRSVKERSDLMKFGQESFAEDLLEVVDNLERAVHQIPPGTDPSLAKGLNLVLGQFKSVLEKRGIQPIDTQNKEFDPNHHEAIASIASEEPRGKILQEHARGYRIHDRLLRPARVTVSGGKEGSK